MTDHRIHPSVPDPATNPAFIEPTSDPARAAPIPVGDVVPGDPPVPITVWPVPPPEPGNTMSNGLGVRLVHNYTHPGELIVDLTDGPQLARAIIAAGRRSHLNQPGVVRNRTEPVALVATDWTAPNPNGTEFLAWCATLLRPLGCVAVVLDHDGPTEPSEVIAAGRHAGLGYLQHVVAATGLTADNRPLPGARLRVHTDVIIFIRSTSSASSAEVRVPQGEPKAPSTPARYRRSGGSL